jgi:hypothetical protein
MVMLRGRAIRSEANLPPSLWAKCVQVAIYLKNHTPTRTIKDVTPHEVWSGKKLDLSRLCELGCCAFVLMQNKNNLKIYGRSIKCVLSDTWITPNDIAATIRTWDKLSSHMMSDLLKQRMMKNVLYIQVILPQLDSV